MISNNNIASKWIIISSIMVILFSVFFESYFNIKYTKIYHIYDILQVKNINNNLLSESSYSHTFLFIFFINFVFLIISITLWRVGVVRAQPKKGVKNYAFYYGFILLFFGIVQFFFPPIEGGAPGLRFFRLIFYNSHADISRLVLLQVLIIILCMWIFDYIVHTKIKE